jgi:hypothetical protein
MVPLKVLSIDPSPKASATPRIFFQHSLPVGDPAPTSRIPRAYRDDRKVQREAKRRAKAAKRSQRKAAK